MGKSPPFHRNGAAQAPMTARILDGKNTAALRRQRLSAEVQETLRAGHRAPGLAVVLVGGDPASTVYVRKKREACAEVGIHSRDYDLPRETSERELLELVDTLNEDPDVDGILVQLPLPEAIDPQVVLERIHPSKDVDGFHPCNMGRLALRMPELRPCTPRGVMNLLEEYDIPLAGRDAVVVGQSNIVGRPMALELLNARCTVTICHSRTRDVEARVRGSDLVVAAVGHPGMIRGDWIRPGAVVIDVGISRLDDGRLAGDVEFEAAREHADWITPVPGGVGPMTVVTLLENTLDAARQRRQASSAR